MEWGAIQNVLRCHGTVPFASFTAGRPWLPIGADHVFVNVASLEKDEASILQLYRELIALRRVNPTLIGSEMRSVMADNNLLRYERAKGDDRVAVLLNLGDEFVRVAVETGNVIASTHFDRKGDRVMDFVELRAAEGLIVAIDSPTQATPSP